MKHLKNARNWRDVLLDCHSLHYCPWVHRYLALDSITGRFGRGVTSRRDCSDKIEDPVYHYLDSAES